MHFSFAQLPNDAVVFVAAIVLSSVLLPLLVPLYRRFGLIDRPNARSSHTREIPRGVGLVLVLSFWAVVAGCRLLAGEGGFPESFRLGPFLTASVLLVGVGFVDDAHGVSARIKLLTQLVSAAILVVAGFVIPLPQVFGGFQPWVEGGLTWLWIVGVINAVNFIDGSDGLCTSLSAACMLLFVALSSLAFLEEPGSTLELTRGTRLLGFAAAGAALPFLLYNLAPAKCFLGDAGSMFFGLVLALLGVLVTQYARPPGDWAEVAGAAAAPAPAAPYRYVLVPWIVLFVPIGDSLRVAAWRVIRGRSPFHPDNTHLHHLLQRAGLTPNQRVFSVCLLCFISGLLAAFVVQTNPSSVLWIGTGMLLVLGQLWFLKTSYRVRRFVTTLMNKRLLMSADAPQGYENAPVFKERVEQELSRAKRRGRPLSVMIVTVSGRDLARPGASPLENPKFLEDLLGALRREDVKARLTPDRLAFLLVEADRSTAEEVVKRIEARFIAIQVGESRDLLWGIGLSSCPENGGTPRDLFNAADAAAAENLGSRFAPEGEESRERDPGREADRPRREPPG
jgi:UDP-GlcNAc:undecaprenyl-phosphate GlcNAc-1-phosphate transferase